MTEINGQSTRLTYDGRGRTVEIRDETDGSRGTLAYENGEATPRTDPDGVTFSCQYDPDCGRLERVTDMEGEHHPDRLR